MAQTPKALQPYSSLRHFVGAEFRRWRTLRGLSQDELGRRTHHSGDLVGKVEKAERRPTVELAASCDQVLATGGALGQLVGLLHTQDRSGPMLAEPTSIEQQAYADTTHQDAEGHRQVSSRHDDTREPSTVTGRSTAAPVFSWDYISAAGGAWFGLLPVDQDQLVESANVPMSVPDRIGQPHVGAPEFVKVGETRGC